VPFGTNVSALVATFATTGAAVTVGAAPQTSGTTSNDFTSPVIYAVTAADTSTQTYVVTVTVHAAVIGQDYLYGKIASVFQSGDPGYVAGETHGLIAAAGDAGTFVHWSNLTFTWIGTTGTALGTGWANTEAIVWNPIGVTSAAAYLCGTFGYGGYDDWFLPSKDELNKLYVNRAAIGGFSSMQYWSSSELGASNAWAQSFYNGTLTGPYKGDIETANARAVRYF
jgi:hypothetical protein